MLDPKMFPIDFRLQGTASVCNLSLQGCLYVSTDRRYRHATSAIIVLLAVLCFLARQLINYCFRAAAAAAALETPGALFAQRRLEERWGSLSTKL